MSVLRPSSFIEGGLIDDFDGKVTDAKFIMYDYNGKQPDNPVPALGVEIELPDGTKHESYYSAGDARYWRPNADGTDLTKVGDKDHLTKSCKLGIFLTELINAGFSEAKLDGGNIKTALTGLMAHWVRKADKERKGLTRTEEQAKKGEQSTLVVSKIIAMPGEAPKNVPKPQAVGAPSATASSTPSTTSTAPASVDGVDDDATSLLLEIVPANGGTVAKAKLSLIAFKHIGKDHPLFAKRTAVTQRVFNDEFLKAGANTGLWAYDGTNVTIAS